jgi:hypothetical protein
VRRKEAKQRIEDEDRLPQPRRVRLPGFIGDEEIGLGDVIKHATSGAGIRPCGSCTRRAAVLNRWMVFTGRPAPR